MANEGNYTIVLLPNDNKVLKYFCCPNCQNDDIDTLELNDNDTVTCLYCGTHYQI